MADFDLLTRLPQLEAVDIVATDGLLGSGFHQRIHEWLPGIEEVEAVAIGLAPAPSARPVLEVPDVGADSLVFVRRDREEELIAVARDVRDARSVDRVAVVFKRPLPYLYLAPQVFGSARIPFRISDALPLAAESMAAAVDLVLDVAQAGFTRASLVALMRSPHFVFVGEGAQVDRDAISALDRELSKARFLGGLEALVALEDAWAKEPAKRQPARPAMIAARALAERLSPLLTAAPASAQLTLILDFLDAHARPTAEHDALGPRLDRGRAAVREALRALAAAHAEHDDRPMTIAEVAARCTGGSRSRRSCPIRPATACSCSTIRRRGTANSTDRDRRPHRRRVAGPAAAEHLLPAVRCSRRSAGRRNRIGVEQPRRDSWNSWPRRPSACRSRRSRWTTRRSSSRRPSSTTSRARDCRSRRAAGGDGGHGVQGRSADDAGAHAVTVVACSMRTGRVGGDAR